MALKTRWALALVLFAAYFIVLMMVNHVTFSWIMFEYDYRVRQGTLSFALLRPVHPIHADIADNVSFKLIRRMDHREGSSTVHHIGRAA